MRLLLVLLALLALGAWAQQPPALGSHEFGTVTVTADSSNSFPADARVLLRNYTVQTFGTRVLRAVGYRLAVANTSTSVGVAFDVVAGAVSTFLDAAVGIGYYGARAGLQVNPADNSVVLGFAEAAWAFVARFFYIVEWVDTNNNGQIDFGANEVLGGYDLSSLFATWTPLDYGRITQNGVGYNYVQTETTDGVFAFRVLSSGNYVSVSEAGTSAQKLNPSSLKISVSIRYFNNSANTPRLGLSTGPSSNPNAKVALIVGFGAAAGAGGIGVKINTDTGATDFNGNPLKNVQVDGAGNKAGFSWVGSAAARDSQGVTIAAGAAVAGVFVNDATIPNVTFANRFGAGAYAGFKLARLGVFTFDPVRPSSVVWDPTVSTTDSPAAVVVPALALLLAMLAMLVM